MILRIRNLQSKRRITARRIREMLKPVSVSLGLKGKELSLVLCDNAAIQNINRDFLGHDWATDVISFPSEDSYNPSLLGEIVVSAEQAEIKRKEYGTDWEKELALYMIHGILHLCGYNDKTVSQRKVMRAKEQEELARIFPDHESPDTSE